MSIQEQLKKWAVSTGDDKLKQTAAHAESQFEIAQRKRETRERRRAHQERKAHLATDKAVKKLHEQAVKTVAEKVVDAIVAENDLVRRGNK